MYVNKQTKVKVTENDLPTLTLLNVFRNVTNWRYAILVHLPNTPGEVAKQLSGLLVTSVRKKGGTQAWRTSM